MQQVDGNKESTQYSAQNKVLVYIVYGDETAYYQGAVVSLLTFLATWQGGEPPLIVVLTEQEHWFEDLPVLVLPLSATQKTEWSLQGRYNFRIKNRGLAWVMDTLLAEQRIAPQSKVLFCDTDTYFPRSAQPIYALIDDHHAVMYLREGRISEKKSMRGYLEDLKDKTLQVSRDWKYQIDPASEMWGSLLIGMTSSKRSLLDRADVLMQAMQSHCRMHTIEQFCLAEVLSEYMTLCEGKRWVRHYSRLNQKDWAVLQLDKFIVQAYGKTLAEKMALAQRISFTRPLSLVIKQKLAGSRWK